MCRALLVDDNPEVVDYVGEILEHSLQHRFDVAGSNEDACRLLKANEYDYVLLDLEIPASSRGSRARVQNGASMFRQIVQHLGAGMIPIIIMTSHPQEALNLLGDFQNDGLTFGLSKDRWTDPGCTVEDVVRKALEAAEHGRQAPRTADEGKLKPFLQGEVVIYADGVTLCGRRIVDNGNLSLMREILLVLNARDGATYKRFPARLIAKDPRVDRKGDASAVGGAIYRFRKKVAEVLRDECGIDCKPSDLICTQRGYHLAERVTVTLRLEESIDATAVGSKNGSDGPNRGPNGPDGPCDGLDFHDVGQRQKDRLRAIVGEMRKRKKMTRGELEAFTGVKRSQVTRDLAVLEEAGALRRVGPTKARQYELDPKWAG